MSHYRCIPVESDRYSLALMRYINQTPFEREWWKTRRLAMDWIPLIRVGVQRVNHPHVSYLALG
jgi:hypothetical protein